MFEILGASLALTGLLVIHCLGLLLTAGSWRAIAHTAASWSSSARVRFLFWLRAAPGLSAVLLVTALFTPAYLAHEPRDTTEIVTAELGILAGLSLGGTIFALWRAYANCLATRRLVDDWLRHSVSIRMENTGIPAYRLSHAFPVIAIVGVIRPKLFIADQVFQALSGAEVSAAVAHENGHLAARDNFKRGLLNACRHALGFLPLGRSLEREWRRAAESAADEFAARGGSETALDLASALIKVARLVPTGARPAMPAVASLISEDYSSIGARILRLTELAARGSLPPGLRFPMMPLAMGGCLSGILLGMILAVSGYDFLARVHLALEYFVAVLQ